jgi:hypothetical protein
VIFCPSRVPSALGEAPGIQLLPLVVGRDAPCGGFERHTLGNRQSIERPLQLGWVQLQIGHGGRIELVEATRVVEHGRIAVGAHILENFSDDLFNRIVGRMIEMQQLDQRRNETGIARR